MSVLRKLGTNSAIYTATTMLQKGTAFLLMPLYTSYLGPSSYGVLAIVTSVNGLLSVAFTLGLTSAVTRFYFEHQHDHAALAEFWGTILTFITLLSLALGLILFWVGDVLLKPLAGDIAFWPYLALGVAATFFQPLFAGVLSVLQARNQAGRYALLSLGQFALSTGLTIALVVFLSWGVTGALTATLIAAAVFFLISLWLLRKDFRLCLKWRHLRPALSYGLPQVPHMVASQITATTDRLVLNARLGSAATGLYSVGAMVALIIEIAAQSINRAYVPLSMQALKQRSPTDLAQLRMLGALIVSGSCLLGVGVAAFGREIIWLLASPAFAASAQVVPILAFVGVASSIYYLLVSVLFYERGAVKLIPIGTLTASGLSVALALLFVPRFGLIGAACATLLAQCTATVLIAIIARRYDPVQWDYPRYGLAFALSLSAGLILGNLAIDGIVLAVGIKLIGLCACAMLHGMLFWHRPLVFGQAFMYLIRRRSGALAALFSTKEGALT